MKQSEIYEDDTKTNYRCNKCRDLRFIIDDNTAIPCECRAIIEAENMLKDSEISEGFKNKSFENYDFTTNTIRANAYSKAKIYTNNFINTCKEKKEKDSIIFMGQVGSGKTHLSIAIANELMKNNIGVIYMSYRDIITKIKQNMLDKEYYIRIMNKYKNARVLLIDDMFKGGISNSDINIMFEIINHRYFNNMPIIVSTEKSREELLQIDEAIGSRVIEMSGDFVVDMRGKKLNYRLA